MSKPFFKMFSAEKISNSDEGVWRTINGSPVFIKEGQSVSDAVAEKLGKSKGKDDPTDSKNHGKAVPGQRKESAQTDKIAAKQKEDAKKVSELRKYAHDNDPDKKKHNLYGDAHKATMATVGKTGEEAVRLHKAAADAHSKSMAYYEGKGGKENKARYEMHKRQMGIHLSKVDEVANSSGVKDIFKLSNNCGTGAGGFQPGNSCGSGGGVGKSSKSEHGKTVADVVDGRHTSSVEYDQGKFKSVFHPIEHKDPGAAVKKAHDFLTSEESGMASVGNPIAKGIRGSWAVSAEDAGGNKHHFHFSQSKQTGAVQSMSPFS